MNDLAADKKGNNMREGLRKIFSKIGLAGAIAGGGFLCLTVSLLQFAFVGLCGLATIWLSIHFFFAGSILWGVLTLFVGTPLVIGITSWSFPFLLPLAIVSGIVWGCIRLFGGEASFTSVWDGVWLAIKILLIGGMAILGVMGFVGSVKNRKVCAFFKESWLGVLGFLFLVWLFFFL